MDAKAWISVAAAVVALGSLVLAYLSRRDAKKSALSAKDDAAAANRRADEANDSARRAAEAVERVASVQEEQAAASKAERERFVPQWRLTWARGDTYTLQNGSDELALDVQLSGDVVEFGGRKPPSAVVVDAHSALNFMAIRHSGMTNDNVVVNWRRPAEGGSTEHRWAAPLPHRPPRN